MKINLVLKDNIATYGTCWSLSRKFWLNHAFRIIEMELGEIIEFGALKKIGSRLLLRNACKSKF